MLKLFFNIWGPSIPSARLVCGAGAWVLSLLLCMLIKTRKSPVLYVIPLLATSKNFANNLHNDLPIGSYLFSQVLHFLSFQALSNRKYFLLNKEQLWDYSIGSFGKTCQKSLHSGVFHSSQRRQFHKSKTHIKVTRIVCRIEEDNDSGGVTFY